MEGPGYWFQTSTAHDVERAGRTVRVEGEGIGVSVTTFRLRRTFEPAMWEEVVPEIDRVAAGLADRLGARSVGRTVVVATRRARAYDFTGARDGTRRVAFVLHRDREYQLLCRWDDDQEERGRAACVDLFASFTLSSR